MQNRKKEKKGENEKKPKFNAFKVKIFTF